MKNLLEIAKIFVLALLVIVPAKVSAIDYYVGNYSDGSKAYLMTETVKKIGKNPEFHYGRYYYDYEYEVVVKAVYRNSSVKYINYTINPDPELEVTKNGKFYNNQECRRLFGEGTVERNMANYLTRNFG